ncbi:hypothetical protein LPJ59_003171 [Coemansia sp. RSA 2399]|nr:hypothetical protein LPJ59_003171 [Coemansia sp. RSA 2399]KAJ1903897.1 hypothetical protein LPJ81_002815 [Coemansia sp. IMI 209127]
MDSQLEPLRIHDYTLRATLGLTTLYAKISQQIEDENELLSSQVSAQRNLNSAYDSTQLSYGRHSSSTMFGLGRPSSPQSAMNSLTKSVSNQRSKRKGMIDNGANTSSDAVVDVKSQTQSPAVSRQRSTGVGSNGQPARTKRSRNTNNSHRTTAGKGGHLRSAFARVRPEKPAHTEGDVSLDNGAANLAGRRNKAHACKVNQNASVNPGAADARPREYGEVWFDRYMIIAKLGEGAFSQAFLAADLHCNRMGKRHDGIRLVTIKRMGLKEGTIGISDFETISMLNRLDPGERIPIVRVYGVFLHRPISRRTVEYDSVSRQLLPVQVSNAELGQHAFSLMTDSDYSRHYYNDVSRLRVFGSRAEPDISGFPHGTETLASATSYEENRYHVCLVMEPLLGSTLHDAFPQRIKALYGTHDDIIAKRMHIDMIRTVIRQLLVALAHMHSNSLIHADIKTTNVICVDDSSLRVKLIDFGNSVSDGDVPEYYTTFEIQTVWFRAPEVAYQRPFGRAIDMWSIGCVMCELWLGRSLFTDMDNANLIRSILKLRGPPPAQLYSASPVYLDIVRSWCGRPTPGFAPAAVGGRHKSSMHPEMNIDWDPQLRMQWLKHSLHAHDDDFVSLADALLEYDPEERLTAAEALDHPFFQGMYSF